MWKNRYFLWKLTLIEQILVLRPWQKIPIEDNDEPLVELPTELLRLEPHPYLSIGAPYHASLSPWRLRKNVIDRLISAQDSIKKIEPGLQLAVFDAWRPIEVQSFMVDFVIKEKCLMEGISANKPETSVAYKQIVEEVHRFWAPPSCNPLTPPPHSTGGAVDITMATIDGQQLNMGGDIDFIGEISKPSYYIDYFYKDPDSSQSRWHLRRTNLLEAMSNSGFVQHPNEWWHFSYGDQLWAWSTNSPKARYGSRSGR